MRLYPKSSRLTSARTGGGSSRTNSILRGSGLIILVFLAFRSRVLAYVAYYSPAASLLHKILYLFRQPFYNYKSPDTTLDPTDRH